MGVESTKEIPVHCPKSLIFKEESKRYTNLSLEFYEAVVRHSIWEILLHMCSDKEIEML